MENELQAQINQLRVQVEDLRGQVYKNNFPSHQDFNKTCYFNGRLKVPVVSSLPSTCELGEIVSFGGVIYACITANTWQKVGLQS